MRERGILLEERKSVLWSKVRSYVSARFHRDESVMNLDGFALSAEEWAIVKENKAVAGEAIPTHKDDYPFFLNRKQTEDNLLVKLSLKKENGFLSFS